MDEFDEKLLLLPDKKKIEIIKKHWKDYRYIRPLIMSLQKDKSKSQMISYLYYTDQIDLIISLKSDKLKLDYLEYLDLGDEDDAIAIAQSIKSDEIKNQALALFETDFAKQTIIVTMQSDENKIKAMLEHIKDPKYYYKIIYSLSSPQNKIACLKYLNSFLAKFEILKSIKFENDEQIINVAKSLKDEDLARRINNKS